MARAWTGEIGGVAIVGERDDAAEFEFEISLADGSDLAVERREASFGLGASGF